MKRFAQVFFLIFSIFFGCKEKKINKVSKIEITNFKIDSASIRAIDILNDSILTFTGSNGVFGMINSSKKSTIIKKIKYDSIIPEFRAISHTKKAIFLLSVGNPALLYKYKNDSLSVVYKEENKKVFYDAMQFFDDENGIAMGDPTDSCLSIIVTKNGGNTWHKIDCKNLPLINAGEAAFAASNTNITIIKNNVWIATGGKKARVFHSSNKGKNWKVVSTPLIHGKNTTGIYSVAFFDKNNGIIAGGDYTNKFGNSINKAITNDGGKTWQIVSENLAPKYVSCVQYVPNSKGEKVFAVSTNGIFYSYNKGKNWQQINKKGYYSIRFASKNSAWLSGNNVIAKMNIKY